MKKSRRFTAVAAFAATVVMIVAIPERRGSAQQTPVGEWRTYGADKGFTRYSPLDQIDRDTVKNLKPVWRRPAIDPQVMEKFPDLVASNYFRGTPIMIDGVLYAPDGVGLIEAFDPATGRTIWVQQPSRATLKEATGQSTRGVGYWRRGTDTRIISVRGEYLYALNARTGAPIRDFGENGRIFLNRRTPDDARYFGFPGPLIVGDVIVVGGNGGGKSGEGYGDDGFEARSKPEDIRGYDVVTGKLLWTFHVLPQKGERGAETWEKGSGEFVGNMAAWASMTADEELGYVYVPLSAPTVSYYGGHRHGQNLFSDCLVVLNARTGQLVWYFQMVHHDLWDYDSATPPVLGDITVDGKRIKAVFAANKTGFLYVFDRVNGTPVWPIEEKPVPQSDVPGEQTSPTQPFPSRPPAIDRQGIAEDDLIDFTPELRKRALDVAKQYVMGPLFTPPTVKTAGATARKGTLAFPNAWGSANWNTGAFDPETGMYYAASWGQVGTYGLTKASDPRSTMAYAIGEEPSQQPRHTNDDEKRVQPESRDLSIDGLPITKPPYSRLTAVNMNTGTLVWSVANGDGPRNHPLLKDLNLPPLGNPGRPVALLTKTLLFVGDSSNAVFGRGGVAGPAKLRAYDKSTGQLVAEHELPVGTTGGPITYLAGGTQFIVVPIGGKGYGAGWVAFAVAPAAEGITLTSLEPSARGADAVTPLSYTDAQARRGEALFLKNCATCHTQGGWGPPLRGDAFWSSWDGKPARSLYSTIVSSMPPDDPGSMTEKNAVDTVAYIFRMNRLRAGDKEIRHAADLNGVPLTRPKP
jgi:glucose dehydrogenase/cytochrome c5